MVARPSSGACLVSLLRLLWYIGGSPPVLRGVAAAPPGPPRSCAAWLGGAVAGADLVTRASVVSRSRVQDGQYFATFRIDKLLHVSIRNMTITNKNQ